MTFEHATELLPWLLNGTLAAAERDEVWHHLETCERCRRDLAETREAWSVFAQHLPSQDLVALAWGEAPSAAVEEHLESCARCAAELELVRMSRRLEEDDKIAVFPAAKPRPAAAPRRWQAAAIAASLVAVVSAFGWIQAERQAGDLSSRLARTEAPVTSGERPAGEPAKQEQPAAEVDRVSRLTNLLKETEKKAADAETQIAQLENDFQALVTPQAAAMVDLGPGDVVRGEASEKTVRSDQYVTLLLPARGAASGEREAEVVNASGEVVRRLSRLPVTQEFHSIVLPPGSLPPGAYTLHIAGRDETWAFRVVR